MKDQTTPQHTYMWVDQNPAKQPVVCECGQRFWVDTEWVRHADTDSSQWSYT